MTVKNIYVSPIIQEFSLQGTIFVNSMADATRLTTDIKNGIYSYLNTNADFNVPVRLSNLIEIIEKNQGILYSNVQLVPTEISGRALLGVEGDDVTIAVKEDSSITQWLDTFAPPFPTGYYDLSAAIATAITIVWTSYGISTDLDTCKSKDMSYSFKHQMTESWFWKSFVNDIYNALNDPIYYEFAGSIYFDQLIMKIKNTFAYPVRYNMMVTTNSDNSRTKIEDISHYTLRTELPKITFEAGVMYK
jgi:hypothetical protein